MNGYQPVKAKGTSTKPSEPPQLTGRVPSKPLNISLRSPYGSPKSMEENIYKPLRMLFSGIVEMIKAEEEVVEKEKSSDLKKELLDVLTSDWFYALRESEYVQTPLFEIQKSYLLSSYNGYMMYIFGKTNGNPTVDQVFPLFEDLAKSAGIAGYESYITFVKTVLEQSLLEYYTVRLMTSRENGPFKKLED